MELILLALAFFAVRQYRREQSYEGTVRPDLGAEAHPIGDEPDADGTILPPRQAHDLYTGDERSLLNEDLEVD